MEQKNFKYISELIGKGVDVKENKKSLSKKEDQLFFTIVENLKNLENKSVAAEELGINLVQYEEEFYVIIEQLLALHYGEFASALIIWYCLDEHNDDEDLILADSDGNEYQIESSQALLKFIKKWK